jgi:hypothetical protein
MSANPDYNHPVYSTKTGIYKLNSDIWTWRVFVPSASAE